MKAFLRFAAYIFFDVAFFCFIVLFAFLCGIKNRSKKSRKIGLGPEPLINNFYHKKALEIYGYEAETFVTHVYFIIDKFDKRFDQIFKSKITKVLKAYLVFMYTMYNYKIIYLYFNGSAFALSGSRLKKFEAFFYKLAGVKTFLMPYGGDVANMLFAKELRYRNALTKDYPAFRKQKRKVEKQVDYWSKNADCILSGCDWVDYMYGWDKLCLAHFSIDLDYIDSLNLRSDEPRKDNTFKVLHAPNHRNIKGTKHIIKAIDELKFEGLDIELSLLEKKPNIEVLKTMANVDLVVDQLIIGWYAMFALEGMSLGKPVVTYIREDLLDLYYEEGLLESREEIGLVNSSPEEIKETLRKFYNNRDLLKTAGEHGRKYVEKYHSIKAIGKIFDEVNKELLK